MDDKLNLECSHPLVEKVFFHGGGSLYDDKKMVMGLTVCLKDGNTEIRETFINESGDEANLVKRANEFLDKKGWIDNDEGVSIWGGEK